MTNPNIKDHASKGGLALRDSMTPKQRSVSASIAANARWKKHKLRKDHVCTNMCHCVNCGRVKYKHATPESIEEFKCVSR